MHDKVRQIIDKEPTKNSNLQFQVKEEKRLKVSILTNAVHYSLFRVYIFEDKGKFRLIVFNRGKLLTDEIYKTARAARIAFLKLWGFQRETEKVNAKWTHFHSPEKNWLKTWYHFVIERKFISVLINRVLYFLETVFIMTVKDGYRLIVINRGTVLIDEIYKTFEGAKRSFISNFNYRAWINGVKPNWSHFYPPDDRWLTKQLEITDTSY